MGREPINCICQQQTNTIEYFPLSRLLQIRESCPAIREILIPKSLLPYFEETYLKNLDRAWHSSISLLALQNGRLSQITSPLHRFGFNFNTDLASTRFVSSYKNALSENYLLPPSSGEDIISAELWRHQTFKKFFGLLVELMAAFWIEDSSYLLENLGAWGGTYDVELRDESNNDWVAEIKSIGQDDVEFEDFIGSQVHVGNPYAAVNFVLFRIGEGLLQVRRSSKLRHVIIIINEIVWPNFDLQLKNNWVDWQRPSFLTGAGSCWQDFASRTKKFSTVEKSVADIPNELDLLWIVKLNADLTLTLFQEIRLRNRSI